jgi:hypothetical protein
VAIRVYIRGPAVNGYRMTVAPDTSLCDDVLEDNDGYADATFVGSADVFFDSLVSVANDDDWFEVEVCAGGTLVLDASFTAADGDIDLFVYGQDGTSMLVLANTSTDNEHLEHTNASGASVIWYVDVRIRGMAVNGYDLSIVSDCTLEDDRLEDNDDWTTATAADPAGSYFGGLVGISGDDDWFRVDVCAGGTVNFDAFFRAAGGDLELGLYDEDGTSALAVSNSSTDDEHLSFENARGTARTLYARVFARGAGIVNSYSFRIDVISTLCDDFLEDNDTPETAQSIIGPSAVYNFLVSIDGDDDYFKGWLCAGGIMTVTLLFEHAGGDIDVVMTDANMGTSLGMANSSTDNEIILYRDEVGIGNEYLIRVYSAGGSVNSYDIIIDTGCL